MDQGLERSAAQRHWVAEQVKHQWAGCPGDGLFRSGPVLIDLNTSQGRSEMLALTVLKAARIREGVAEKAFFALRSEGLLSQKRLIAASPLDQKRVEEILRVQYRAQISKRAKMLALFQNEQRLATDWDGDLHHIYLAHPNDGPAMIADLQRFQQMSRRAVWLCREMVAAGVWQGLGPESTAYLDVHVRRALLLLGLAEGKGETWETTRQNCMHAIERYFDGDMVALARHGAMLCQQEALHVCQTQCTVKNACAFWRTNVQKA